MDRDARGNFDFLGRNGKRSLAPARAPMFSSGNGDGGLSEDGRETEEGGADGILQFEEDSEVTAPAARTIEELINEAQVFEEEGLAL